MCYLTAPGNVANSVLNHPITRMLGLYWLINGQKCSTRHDVQYRIRKRRDFRLDTIIIARCKWYANEDERMVANAASIRERPSRSMRLIRTHPSAAVDPYHPVAAHPTVVE